EVVVLDGFGRADGADIEQVFEPGADLVTAGQLVEVSTSKRVLLFGPLLDFGAVAVFEPAIWIGDLDAVELVGGLFDLGGRVRRLRIGGEDGGHDDGYQANEKNALDEDHPNLPCWHASISTIIA